MLTKALDGGGNEQGGRRTIAASVVGVRMDLTTGERGVGYTGAILGSDGATPMVAVWRRMRREADRCVGAIRGGDHAQPKSGHP